MARGDPSVVSASDLADYAYCPRSYYYRCHPPAGGPAPDAARRSQAGERAHARELGGDRRRAAHGALYWLVVVAGAIALVAGVAAWGH